MSLFPEKDDSLLIVYLKGAVTGLITIYGIIAIVYVVLNYLGI